MRIGIIGLGARIAHIARDFAAAEPAARFVAFADPEDTRLPALTDLGADPVRYDDAGAMLAAHQFDLLLIGSPNHLHLDHLRAALQTDTPHIFTEKPVVISVADTLELARLIAAHDGLRRLMVGLVLRYSPLYRALRQAQSDGQLGDIMSIEASEHIGPYHGSFFMRDWRRDSGISGGFMLEKCCHDLDLYQGVVGARPTRVASFGGRKKYLPERRPAAEPGYLTVMAPRWNGVNDAFGGTGDIVDYQTALVEYETGASMAFHTNLNVPDEFRRFCVIGTDGMAEGDFVRNTFRVTRSDDSERLVDRAQIGTGAHKGHYGADAQMGADVMAHIRGDLPALPLSVVDALEAGVTALAIDQARETRQVVELSEIWEAFDHALKGTA